MNATSQDIKDMLLEESDLLDLTFGTNLHIGREPTQPNNCVTIFDTPGAAMGLTLDQKSYEYTSVQIRVRNGDYQAGWDIIDIIKEILHGRAHETWGNTLYTVIMVVSGPMFLDWDDNNRARFIININAQRRKNNEPSN